MNDITNLLSSINTEDVALDTLDTVEEKENTTLDNELGLTVVSNLAEPGTTAQEESTRWKLKPRKSITNKPKVTLVP